MNCIIVDDEPLARDLLEDFTAKVPFLRLKALCKNGFEAMEILQKEKIDLIFLDIQMPDLSGLQLFESLSVKPQVIFTTAYHDYAVEGFELDATDYLVKPFTFERFLKAANKAYRIYHVRNTGEDSLKQTDENTPKEILFVKEGTTTVRINLTDVLYMEGLKDYIKIFTEGKTVLTLMPLKTMEEKLPHDTFIRVHRSYIVSIPKIDSIERNRIIIGENWIPVGDHYKEKFQKRLKRFGG
jgi:DNA-binding LytR/AlgR family response regulator